MQANDIYETIKNMLENGEYKVGSMIPSVKILSIKLYVDMEAIQTALNTLEDNGYIDRSPCSGYIVRSLTKQKR